MTGLRGVFAAAVTPLLDGGARIDEPGIAAMAEFLAEGGVDGALVCGTAGEGVALSVPERQRALEAYIAAGGSRISLMAHAGAQTTADTVALAAHAAEAGAAGGSVLAPPYFPLDGRALPEHPAPAAGAALPPARRSPARRPPRRRAGGLAPRAVPPLLLPRSQWLPDPPPAARATRRARLQPRRPQGVGEAVGALRAVSARRPGRLLR